MALRGFRREPRSWKERVPVKVDFGKLRSLFRNPGVLASLACLCLLLGFFLGSLHARSRSADASVLAKAPGEAVRALPPELVDINTADEELLQTLPGIGPALAERIVAYREEHGGFRYLYELTDVKGIGSSTFEALQGLITLNETED